MPNSSYRLNYIHKWRAELAKLTAVSAPILCSCMALPPFGITSRQNMQSLQLRPQRGADSKCPRQTVRQKLFHIPQQEGLTRSNLKQENGSSSNRFVEIFCQLTTTCNLRVEEVIYFQKISSTAQLKKILLPKVFSCLAIPWKKLWNR